MNDNFKKKLAQGAIVILGTLASGLLAMCVKIKPDDAIEAGTGEIEVPYEVMPDEEVSEEEKEE